MLKADLGSDDDDSLDELPVISKSTPSFLASAFGSFSEKTKTKDELDHYIALDTIGFQDDPLAWWRAREASLPALALLARQYLAVPVSSVSCERVFSASGITMNKQRTKLSAATFGELVFLRHNRELFGTLFPEHGAQILGSKKRRHDSHN